MSLRPPGGPGAAGALLYPDDADPPAALGEAMQGAERLQAIITDLLLLARLGSTGTVVHDHIDLVTAQTAHRSSTQIYTDLEPAVMVRGEPDQLNRLLNNLLDNAERHAHTTVEVELHRHDGHTVLTVTDDGTGIPPEHRERIFERFTRLDTARNRDAGGTGLGLTIAREIAHTHDGTLQVEHSPQGARFAFRLPTSETAAGHD